jgi:hypothetical protein
MVAVLVDASAILAALAAAGWNIDQIVESLKKKGETKHAQTIENLKAAAVPVTVANPLGNPDAPE